MKTFGYYLRALFIWGVVWRVLLFQQLSFLSHLCSPTVVIHMGHRAEQLPLSENMGNYTAESINKLVQKEIWGFAQIIYFYFYLLYPCLCYIHSSLNYR